MDARHATLRLVPVTVPSSPVPAPDAASLAEMLRGAVAAFGIGRPRVRQTRPENCVQTAVAAALGVTLDEVEHVAGTTGRMTIPDALGLFARFGVGVRLVEPGFAAQFWSTVSGEAGGPRLRGIGFRVPGDGETIGHAYLLQGARLVDPATGLGVGITPARLLAMSRIALIPADVRPVRPHRVTAPHRS